MDAQLPLTRVLAMLVTVGRAMPPHALRFEPARLADPTGDRNSIADLPEFAELAGVRHRLLHDGIVSQTKLDRLVPEKNVHLSVPDKGPLMSRAQVGFPIALDVCLVEDSKWRPLTFPVAFSSLDHPSTPVNPVSPQTDVLFDSVYPKDCFVGCHCHFPSFTLSTPSGKGLSPVIPVSILKGGLVQYLGNYR